MDSRTLVRQTLDFDNPERVPIQKWILPWAEARHPEMLKRLHRDFPDDLVAAPAAYSKPLPVQGDRYSKGVYVDEWGCTFNNLQDGAIGIVTEPLIKDWSDLDRFEAPAAMLDLDQDAVNRFCCSTDRFVLAGSWVRPFERLGFIRTMEQSLIDLMEQAPELDTLLQRIHDHYLMELEAWASTEVDALCIMDDWGTQQGLMISPKIWRRLFKPLYKDYVDIARRHGKYIFMHSDGHILEIIPDLIEIGVDALNSQIHCMGVEELGNRFRGKITFWGEVDRQHLLAFGSVKEVRAAVQEIKAHLADQGGVIAQCEFGLAAKPENVYEVFRTWKNLDEPA